MKKKNLSKKLSFNKSTIASLSGEEQGNLHGGEVITREATRLTCVEHSCILSCEAATCDFTYCPWTNCGDSVHTPCYC